MTFEKWLIIIIGIIIVALFTWYEIAKFLKQKKEGKQKTKDKKQQMEEGETEEWKTKASQKLQKMYYFSLQC